MLASYYADGQPDKLFRERIYELSWCGDDAQFGACIQMQIFRVREQTVEALRAASGDAGRVSWEPDDVDDALLIPELAGLCRDGSLSRCTVLVTASQSAAARRLAAAMRSALAALYHAR